MIACCSPTTTAIVIEGLRALLDGEPDIKVALDHRRHGSRQARRAAQAGRVVLDLELTTSRDAGHRRVARRTTPPKVLVSRLQRRRVAPLGARRRAEVSL